MKIKGIVRWATFTTRRFLLSSPFPPLAPTTISLLLHSTTVNKQMVLLHFRCVCSVFGALFSLSLSYHLAYRGNYLPFPPSTILPLPIPTAPSYPLIRYPHSALFPMNTLSAVVCSQCIVIYLRYPVSVHRANDSYFVCSVGGKLRQSSITIPLPCCFATCTLSTAFHCCRPQIVYVY